MTYPLNFMAQTFSKEHSEEYNQEILAYQTKLQSRDLPVIYSLNHLCLLAGVNIQRISMYCKGDRIAQYKRFKLQKKRGGFRVIQTPIDDLKYLQRWLLINILQKVPSHPSCKGFDKATSTKTNAATHLNQEALLKIDLLRFYDSIFERRIYGLFKALGFHPNLAVSLAKLCTIVPDQMFLSSFKSNQAQLKKRIVSVAEGVLPQGAPTSPKLSNLTSMNLDNRLSKLALSYGLKYSRYADDIIFSGKQDNLLKVKKVVYRIITDEDYFVNYGKTKLIIKGKPFFVTGLSVSNATVAVPRKRKTDIEHHLFHCLKNGVAAHLKKSKIKNRNFKDWLLGNIAYVFSIEQEVGKQYFREFNKIQWPI